MTAKDMTTGQIQGLKASVLPQETAEMTITATAGPIIQDPHEAVMTPAHQGEVSIPGLHPAQAGLQEEVATAAVPHPGPAVARQEAETDKEEIIH